jgi:hypothetical protein
MTILVLSSAGYEECEMSSAITDLSAETLSELIEASKGMRRSDWVRFVRESVGKEE